MIEFDSHMTRSPSITVGTRPFGLRRRYSGSWLPPNGPPQSVRSYSMPSSAQVHSTFCTLDEVVRPQIFSIRPSPWPRLLGVGPIDADPRHGASVWATAQRPRRIIGALGSGTREWS